jgi:hypothetical protein
MPGTSQIGYSGEKTMSDVVTPGFHARIRAGEIINNPCNYSVSERVHYGEFLPTVVWVRSNDPTEIWTHAKGNFTDWVVRLSNPNIRFADSEKAVINYDVAVQEAKTKAIANVDSTPFEFFEDVLELRETFRFLRNPLEALKDVTKAYSKKRRKLLKSKDAAKKEAKALAGLWTQYRFAVSPLLRSIFGAIEAYEAYQAGKIHRNTRRTAHGIVIRDANADKMVQAFYNAGAFSRVFDFYCVNEIAASIHASIVYEVSNPAVDINFALGLRAKDIPEVMWQIVPLSFMVDRLINISNAIRGVTNMLDPTVTILAGAVTTRTNSYDKATCTNWYYDQGTYNVQTYENPDSLIFSDFDYSRVTWTPSISETIPPFTLGGLTEDVIKTADLVAIILGHVL